MPGISTLLDSDMEGNDQHLHENSTILSASEDSDKQSAVRAKRTKKRHRVTMPKPKTKVAKTSSAPAPKKPTRKTAETRRKAIEAQVEEGTIAESAAEDVLQEVEDEPRERDSVSTPNKRGAHRGIPSAVSKNDEPVETEYASITARSSHARSKSTKPVARVVKAAKAAAATQVSTGSAPETQQSEAMDLDSEADELDGPTVRLAARRNTASRSRQDSTLRRRAGSASDTERGDPNLRRRLGDITRKFENIDAKYRNLKEVGINEASANVEKLRKQSELTTESSNNLIASLKKELSLQTTLANESRKLKKDIQNQQTEIDRLKATNSQLNTSLISTQNEVKALQAKLAAARSHSAEPVPGKALAAPHKTSSTARATATMAESEAAQIAQMKIDLYGDLTGLLVHSVKRADDGDTYDCLQTGRNGSEYFSDISVVYRLTCKALHFKLFIDREDAQNSSFQDTEFLYTPHLDINRDRGMIELMPAYLTEDITFARQNAAKFYQRVVDTLTRRTTDE